MYKCPIYIIILILVCFFSKSSLSGQEILRPSRIQARAVRKNLPELGLPERVSGEIDPTVWYKDGCWHGADSLKASPFWSTETIDNKQVVKTKIPAEIVNFCKEWVKEKPEGPVHIVTGPVRGMQFIAVCTRSKSSIKWKSIGFIIPKSGLQPDKSLWFYSCSTMGKNNISANYQLQKHTTSGVGSNLLPFLFDDFVSTAVIIFCPFF